VTLQPSSRTGLGVLLTLLGLILGIGVNLVADALRSPNGRVESPSSGAALARSERQQQFKNTTFHLLNNPRRTFLRWLLVEFACAAVVPAVWLLHVGSRTNLSWIPALLHTVHLLVLLLLTVTDIEQHRIPNVVVYPAIVLALLAVLVDPSIEDRSALIGGAVGALVFLLLYLMGWGYAALRQSSGVALGAGDVKLAAYIGLITGWPVAALALGLGVLAGGIAAAIAIAVNWARNRYYAGTSMAYGPYLALGAAAVLLLLP